MYVCGLGADGEGGHGGAAVALRRGPGDLFSVYNYI